MIQWWKKTLLLSCVGIFCSMASADAISYAQLSSLFNQPLSGTNVPQAVTIDSIDERHNVKVSGSQIKIKEDGVYLIILAGQVGVAGTVAPPVDSYLDLFLVKNGKNVSNSNTRQSITNINQTGVLVSQTVTKLKKGDVLQAYINGPSDTIGLVVSPGTYPPESLSQNGEPTSPAIIISIANLGS